jgi:hypothetical protein
MERARRGTWPYGFQRPWRNDRMFWIGLATGVCLALVVELAGWGAGAALDVTGWQVPFAARILVWVWVGFVVVGMLTALARGFLRGYRGTPAERGAHVP